MKKIAFVFIVLSLLFLAIRFVAFINIESDQKIDKVRVEVGRSALHSTESNINKTTFEVAEQKHELCKESDKNDKKIESLDINVNTLALRVAEKFKQNNLSKEQQEKIVQNARLPLEEFRKMTVWHHGTDWDDLMPVTGRPISLKGSKRTKYYQYQLSQNYAGIVSMIETGSLTNQSIFNGESVISNLILQNKNIAISDIGQIIDAGLIPTFSDLVELTSANISLEMIDFVANYVTDDINQSWYAHYRNNTLTMITAKNLNYDLFDYWQTKGVPFFAEKSDYTSMDMLVKPTNELEAERAIQIFIILASNNVRPYDVTTLVRLKKWLPEGIQNEFESYFANDDKVELNDFERGVSKSLPNLVRVYNELVAAKEMKILCKKNNSGELDSLSNNLFEHNKTLGKINSQSNTSLLDNQIRKHVLNLMNAKAKGDWDSYLEGTDDVVQQLGSTEMYSAALFQAIQHNAPIEVINHLLERGADMPPNAIIALTLNSNLKLTKQLLPLGLDLYFKDQKNRNALHYAITFNASKSMFEFLLDRNVAITQNIDLLGILLANQASNIVYYSEQLVARGHKITPTHITTYEQFRESNPPLFESLKHIFNSR